jgi:hypothetical protein
MGNSGPVFLEIFHDKIFPRKVLPDAGKNRLEENPGLSLSSS